MNHKSLLFVLPLLLMTFLSACSKDEPPEPYEPTPAIKLAGYYEGKCSSSSYFDGQYSYSCSNSALTVEYVDSTIDYIMIINGLEYRKYSGIDPWVHDYVYQRENGYGTITFSDSARRATIESYISSPNGSRSTECNYSR